MNSPQHHPRVVLHVNVAALRARGCDDSLPSTLTFRDAYAAVDADTLAQARIRELR